MTRWQTRDFVVAGVFAAMTFGVAFALGAGIIMSTGIPATGGVANILAAILIVTVGALIVPKFGFLTLTLGLMFTLAVPTVIGGPLGAFKIINGLLIGIVMDTIVAMGQRRRAAFIIAGSIGAMVSILSIYAALVLLKLPAADRLWPLLFPLTGIQAIAGAIGAWVGWHIYHSRLKNLRFVKSIQGDAG